MNKKRIVLCLCALLVGGAIVLGLFFRMGAAPESSKDRAIKEAKNYRPSGVCAQVITSAHHVATGVTYTFPSSCIPPGWE